MSYDHGKFIRSLLQRLPTRFVDHSLALRDVYYCTTTAAETAGVQSRKYFQGALCAITLNFGVDSEAHLSHRRVVRNPRSCVDACIDGEIVSKICKCACACLRVPARVDVWCGCVGYPPSALDHKFQKS
jgi:hypothetical protein